MTNGTHRHLECLPCWLNKFTVPDRHGFGKGAFKHSCYAGPFAATITETYWMLFHPCIRCINKHCFEVLNMFLNAICMVTIRPVYNNVFRMTFMQAHPLLVTEHSVIQRIECCKVFLQGGIAIGITL